jgi:hypothetical protein
LTADVVSALAEADPAGEGLDKSMDWLSRQTPLTGQSFSVSAVASRLFCLSRYGGLKKYESVINKDIKFLIEAQGNRGGWSDVGPDAREPSTAGMTPSHALTFPPMMALREARYAGAQVEKRAWKQALAYWTEAQAYDGGFRDKLDRFGGLGQATTSAFTAMGAAALLMSVDMAASVDARSCDAFLSHRQQLRGIDRALKWLDENYKEQFKDLGSPNQRPNSLLEGLSLRMLGAASGRAFFHDKDHFIESAKEIFEGYDPGSGLFGAQGEEAPSVARSANALWFIASGAAPTICQRILIGATPSVEETDETDDGKEGDAEDNASKSTKASTPPQWREYSADVSHLVQFLSRERNKKFNWRRTTIERDVRELVEVPLLFVNVVGPVNWKPEQWAKLRDYVYAGGSIVVNVGEGQEAQRGAVVSALKELFPAYELRDLPSDDPLFSLETKIDSPLAVKALGNGIRNFVFLPAQSWSCAWHLYQGAGKEPSLAFMNNLVTYATDSSPPRSSFVASSYAVGAASTQEMTALHAEAGGKLPAYPNLIETMDRLLESNYRLSVKQAPDVARADLFWVSFTGGNQPSEAVKAQMLEAIRDKKFLMVDVVTGNPEWNKNVQQVIRSLGSGISLESLRRADPIYTGQIPGTTGFDVVEAAFRKSLQTKWSTTGRADLYSIQKDGVQVGIFSAHDLASGIGCHLFPDCRGVSPEDARKLTMNAFLAAHGQKRVTTAGR